MKPHTNTRMPKGWKSPFRNVQLAQVCVEPTDGSPPLLVGPAMIKPIADEFCAVIKDQIARGFEKNWSNPHVLVIRTA